jgi:LPXTG-site transpeptidase (sortase) family protein
MLRKIAYWVLVGVISCAVITAIDTYQYILTQNPEVESTKLIDVNASEEKTNRSVSVSFDLISQKELFVPQYLSINSIGLINAQIEQVGVEPNGAMGVPTDPNIVGWYKNGPIAGEKGNIVLAAHYDWYNGTKGAFYLLNKASVGDQIVLNNNSQTKVYQVYEVKYVPNNDISAVYEAFRNTNKQEITLITCGGVWNVIKNSYEERFLVKAILIN